MALEQSHPSDATDARTAAQAIHSELRLGADLLHVATSGSDFDAAREAFVRSADMLAGMDDPADLCWVLRCIGLCDACRPISGVDAAERTRAAVEAFEAASQAGLAPFGPLGWVGLRADLAALQLRGGDRAAAISARATLEALLYDRRLDWEPVAARDVARLLAESLRLGASDNVEVARALIRSAEPVHGQRRYEDAEPLYRRAAELLRDGGGEADAEYRALLHALRCMWQAQGNLREASVNVLDAEREAALDCRVELDPTYAHEVERFVMLFVSAGDHLAAAELLPRLLASSGRRSDEAPAEHARNLALYGQACAQSGRYASAYCAWHAALDLFGEVASADAAVAQAHIAGDLGVLLCARFENLREAGHWLRRSLDAYRNISDVNGLEVAMADLRLAACHRASGELVQAGECLGRAIKGVAELDEIGEAHADCLFERALLTEMQGDAAEACRLGEEFYRGEAARYGAEHPRVADGLELLGRLHLRGGDTAAARRCCEECLRVRTATLGGQHPDIAPVQRMLAVIAARQGRSDDAVKLLRAALLSDSRVFGELLSVGSARYRMEALGRMRRRADMLLTLVTRHIDLAAYDEAVLERLRLSQAVAARFTGGGAFQMETLSLVLYNIVLRRKALDAQIERTHRLSWGRDGERPERLDALLRRLGAVRSAIARRALAPTGGASEDANPLRAAGLNELLDEKDRLETAISVHTPPWRLDQIIQHEGVESVAMGLPDDTALVDYVQFQPIDFEHDLGQGVPAPEPACYLAFVLLSRRLTCTIINLGSAVAIDAAVAEFRRGIHGQAGRDLGADDPEPDEGCSGSVQAGASLRRLVFDPLLKELGGMTRVLICPDGELGSVPFEALPDEHGGFLIDAFRFTYLATSRDAVRFGTSSGHGPSAAPVVVGNPDYELGHSSDGDDAGNRPAPSRAGLPGFRFRPLAGAEDEAAAVGERLGVRPLIGKDALESELKRRGSPRVLHLATHGFVLPAAGSGPLQAFPLLRAGLALAGANTALRGAVPDGPEDGILTAEELLGMDLLGTELVVLSACDTGLGEARVGDGMLGLRHAVAAAGAWSLLVSLWKVPDAETRELMDDFYERLLAGAERIDALRDAQLTMRKRRPEPVYWAGFVCQGLPGAMRFQPVVIGAEAASARVAPIPQARSSSEPEALRVVSDPGRADWFDLDQVFAQVAPNSPLSARQRADVCVRALAQLDLDERHDKGQGGRVMLLYKLAINSAKAGHGEPEENRARAVNAFREALKLTKADGFPFWHHMQIGLAAALHKGRDSSSDELRQAVAAARASFAGFSKGSAPTEWANARVIIGDCLLALCADGAGTKRDLAAAISAYRQAADVFTRERHPAQWRWCKLRQNLARRHRQLGRPPDRFDQRLRGDELEFEP